MIIACIKTNDNWFFREIKQVMKGKVQFPYEEQTWESAFRPRTGLQLYKSWKALKVWFYEPSPVRVIWRIQESFYLMLASRPDDRGDFPQWGVWRAGLGVGGARRQPLGQQQVKERAIIFVTHVIKMIHLKLTEWDIKADFRGDAKDVDLKIQELLEPDRERGKIGVKYQIPR